MPVHDDLGNRMKEYESRNRYFLQKRIPVVIRLDMRAGHTYTRGFGRPFDDIFIAAMQNTAKYLCENIQNVKLSYQQSDEITLVLVDYDKLNTECFFEYRVDKLCSIVASMATMAFNKAIEDATDLAFNKEFYELGLGSTPSEDEEDVYNDELEGLEEKYDKYYSKVGKAMFDARCCNLPKEEVTNNLYWRQLDATRNSIQMVGQANFSHKELHGKSCNQIQDMLMEQKNINWNDYPTYQKRGSCCIKENYETENGMRSRWIVDKDIPIFKCDGREYVDRFVYVGE